jgi:Carboxypeptidase regulatory-like domain
VLTAPTIQALLIFVSLLAAPSREQDQDPSSSLAVVSGVAVNKLTGAPVKSAHVIYTRIDRSAGGSSSPISTDTDSEGHFSLRLPPGSYRVWVERNGFARQNFGALSPAGAGTAITLARGQQLSQITFRMAPLGAIAGRVLDDEGDPVQAAGVQVLRFSYTNGSRQLISVAGASSNDRGEYRVFGLPAGRYLLRVSVPNSPMSRPFEAGSLVPEAQDPYASSYYPGVTDVDSASAVSLGEGGELADMDFHLHTVRALVVRGRLASPINKFASSQIQVVLAHNEGGAASYIDRISAFVDAGSGSFEIHGVSPGSYLLVASQLFAGHPLGGRVPLEVSSATREDATVPLVQAFDISGTVELEGAPRGTVPHLTARLTPSEGLTLGPQPASRAGNDGSILLSGVTPGHWTIAVDSLPDELWVKSESFAGNELVTGDLDLKEAARGQLRIVLAGNGAQISGTVAADGQPGRATVVLVPAATELRGARQMFKVTNTTDRGLFTLRGVRPGSYKLFAFQEIEPFEWFNPEQIRVVEELGIPITVSAGENALRDLVAIPPDALLPR